MKKINLATYIFGIVGMGMLIGTATFFNHTQKFIAKSISAPGTVIDVIEHRSSGRNRGYTYAPKVEFLTSTQEKIEFVSKFSSNPPAYKIKDAVEVLYNPASPKEAEIKSFLALWFGHLIMGTLGLIFLLVGCIPIVYRIYKNRQNKKLMAIGRRVEANIKGIELNESFKVNRRSPYRIVAQWEENNEVYLFYSENLWFDPTNFVKNSKVPVWVDPANPKKYYMDISFLPDIKN